MSRTPVAIQKNPILLWLLIHGGDPGPDDNGPIHHLTAALTVHELANQIASEGTRKQIQAAAAQEVATISQRLVAR